MESNQQRPLKCTADKAMACHTERPFRRQFVYCSCLEGWITQTGKDVIPWTIEAPTEQILLQGIELLFPNRPVSQLNPRKESNVADSRWVGHF